MNMYHRRSLETGLADGASRYKVRLLFGARQTGKTSLLQRLADRETWQVYNLQDRSLRLSWEANPGAFLAELRALPRRIRRVAIDEVQKVPALLDEVQAAYDADPRRFEFYLTGSSARRLRARSANLLPGRCHVFHLHPLVRTEVSGWQSAVPATWGGAGLAVPASGAAGAATPFPTWSLEDDLLYGALPGLRAETRAARGRTLTAYVEVYLEEEIRREALVRDVGAFANFVHLAAVESGRIINLSKLSQESGIPAATLRNFYQVLQDTFVGWTLPPYSRSTRRRLLTTPTADLLPRATDYRDFYLQLTGINPRLCPQCGIGALIRLALPAPLPQVVDTS